jgi:phage terminase large subunit GpA-like protein
MVQLQAGDRVAVALDGGARKGRVTNVEGNIVYVSVKSCGDFKVFPFDRSNVLPMYRGSQGPSLAQVPLTELQ